MPTTPELLELEDELLELELEEELLELLELDDEDEEDEDELLDELLLDELELPVPEELVPPQAVSSNARLKKIRGCFMMATGFFVYAVPPIGRAGGGDLIVVMTAASARRINIL